MESEYAVGVGVGAIVSLFLFWPLALLGVAELYLRWKTGKPAYHENRYDNRYLAGMMRAQELVMKLFIILFVIGFIIGFLSVLL